MMFTTEQAVLETGPITYRKGGNDKKPEGSMSGTDTVKVKEGTVVNVTATDKS